MNNVEIQGLYFGRGGGGRGSLHYDYILEEKVSWSMGEGGKGREGKARQGTGELSTYAKA
jgi:hypothetical protein